MRRPRRDLTAALIVFCLLRRSAAEQTAPVAKGPAARPGPNIVLVILDAARADHFSAYGYPGMTTPFIDAIGRKGAVFLDASAPATGTYEAVPRLLSSRRVSRFLFQSDAWRFGMREATPSDVNLNDDPEQIYLPAFLAARGYATALVTDHYAMLPKTPLGRQFRELVSLRQHGDDEGPSDQNVAAKAAQWLERHGQEKFFLYVHIMSPHAGYPIKDTDAEYLSGFEPALVARVKNKVSEHLDPSASGWSAAELSVLRGLYDSNLKHTDRCVGGLYAALERLHLDRNTVFVVTGDHGENLGDHGRISHGGEPWSSVLHVPLVLVYPPLVPPGAIVRGLTETIDIAPTVLRLAGIALPAGKTMDGRDLMDDVRGPGAGRAQILTEDSILIPPWKLLVRENLLYDLAADPEETTDAASRHSAEAALLRETHRRLFAPLQARFLGAKAAAPPDDPFYVLVPNMNAEPSGAIARYRVQPSSAAPLGGSASGGKPWILSDHGLAPGLARNPAVSSGPAAALSLAMPDGRYRVSVLVESLAGALPPPGGYDVRFRFGPDEPFRRPAIGADIRNTDRKEIRVNASMDLGWTTVTQRRFRLELDAAAAPDKPYMFRHVAFQPEGAPPPSVAPAEAERRRLELQLKRAGYLSE